MCWKNLTNARIKANKTAIPVAAEAKAYISDREYAEYEPDYEEVDDEDDMNKDGLNNDDE